MSIKWGDVYSMQGFGEMPPDPALDALLSMAPENHPARATFEPMLRGLFSQIKEQIGEVNYQKFCTDLQDAAANYAQGNKEPARLMLAAYGMDITMLEAMSGIEADGTD